MSGKTLLPWQFRKRYSRHMEKLIPLDLTAVVEEVKAEGKTRRVLWQDSESIAFLSSGRKERWDLHIDPADEATLQPSGAQQLGYCPTEGEKGSPPITNGPKPPCPASR